MAGHSTTNKSVVKFVAISFIAVTLLSFMSNRIGVDAKVLVNSVRFRRLPPKEFSAVQGSSVIIECEAGSSPPPTVRWLKDGKLIHQSEFDNSVDENAAEPSNSINLSAVRSRLYLDCVDISDEAVYTCVAENAYSKISSNTKLSIVDLDQNEAIVAPTTSAATGGNSAPVSSSGSSQSLDGLMPILQCSKSQSGPRIHMWTHNIIELADNDIQLYCRSNKGKGPDSAYTVSWTGPNDKPILPEQKYKYEVLESGDLLIRQLSWSDMGSYMCTVSDERDNRDTATTFVYPTTSKKTERERTTRRLKTNNVT